MKVEETPGPTPTPTSTPSPTPSVTPAPTPSSTPSSTPTPTPETETPDLHTTAYNGKDGYDTIRPKEETTSVIKDTVYYRNLTPGKQYTVSGTLHLKNGGGWDDGPLKNNGAPVTASLVFTPAAKNGEVTLTFTFPTALVKDETEIVAFETLSADGTEIVSHADIFHPEAQTQNPLDRHGCRKGSGRLWIPRCSCTCGVCDPGEETQQKSRIEPDSHGGPSSDYRKKLPWLLLRFFRDLISHF